MRIIGRLAGVALAGGLAVGVLAGGATGAGASGLQLLPTTTSVSAIPDANDGGTTLVATVSISLLTGALITPAGAVNFVSVYPDGFSSPLGSANLSRCLLGLPPVLGLWTETCSATLVNAPLGCGNQQVTATYTASADLLAKPSSASTEVNYKDC